MYTLTASALACLYNYYISSLIMIAGACLHIQVCKRPMTIQINVIFSDKEPKGTKELKSKSRISYEHRIKSHRPLRTRRLFPGGPGLLQRAFIGDYKASITEWCHYICLLYVWYTDCCRALPVIDATKGFLQTVVKAEGNMNHGGVGAVTPPFLWTPHTPGNTDTHRQTYTNTYTLDRTGKSSADTPEIREKLALTHFCSVTPHCLNVTERLWATATNGK